MRIPIGFVFIGISREGNGMDSCIDCFFCAQPIASSIPLGGVSLWVCVAVANTNQWQDEWNEGAYVRVGKKRKMNYGLRIPTIGVQILSNSCPFTKYLNQFNSSRKFEATANRIIIIQSRKHSIAVRTISPIRITCISNGQYVNENECIIHICQMFRGFVIRLATLNGFAMASFFPPIQYNNFRPLVVIDIKNLQIFLVSDIWYTINSKCLTLVSVGWKRRQLIDTSINSCCTLLIFHFVFNSFFVHRTYAAWPSGRCSIRDIFRLYVIAHRKLGHRHRWPMGLTIDCWLALFGT